MKKILILFIIILYTHFLQAQDKHSVIVKAGTSLLDYFTVSERYLYPEFQIGKVLFKSNNYSERKLNYNYLAGEIEFIQDSDTLSIANKDYIKSIIVDQDTFFYDKGYILQIKSGPPNVGLKEELEFIEIQKKDPYGIASSGSATNTYSSLPSDGKYYELKANHDMKFERTKWYYISKQKSDFVLYNKKNVYKLFPKYKEKIKSFLKTNKIKFDSEEDLLDLAEYLGEL